MPYYPMKCTFSTCGMDFEYFTKPSLYEISKTDSFQDVRCAYCGSFGTSERTYPADSAPANLTVKGTWGKNASPGLKGVEFYTKQERDRQLAAVGKEAFPDGDDVGEKKNSATKTFKRTKDGIIETSNKPKRKTKKTSYDPKMLKPSDLIRQEADSNGGIVNLSILAEKTGLDKRKLRGGIMGAIRQGWLEKTDQERVYRLV